VKLRRGGRERRGVGLGLVCWRREGHEYDSEAEGCVSPTLAKEPVSANAFGGMDI